MSMHPSFAPPNRDRSHKSIPLKLKCGRVVCSNFPTPHSISLFLCSACHTHFIYYYYRLLKQIMNLFWPLCVCIILLPGFYLLPFYAINWARRMRKRSLRFIRCVHFGCSPWKPSPLNVTWIGAWIKNNINIKQYLSRQAWQIGWYKPAPTNTYKWRWMREREFEKQCWNLQAKHIIIHIITAHVGRFDHKNQYTLITIDIEWVRKNSIIVLCRALLRWFNATFGFYLWHTWHTHTHKRTHIR